MPKIDRRAIYERDRGVCGICDTPVLYADMQIDHVLPRGHGGPDDPENLRATHQHCNRTRKLPPRPRPSWLPASLLTVAQAAAYLSVSIDTVRRWCRTGALRCIRLADRAGYRIRQDDLDRFLRERDHAND